MEIAKLIVGSTVVVVNQSPGEASAEGDALAPRKLTAVHRTRRSHGNPSGASCNLDIACMDNVDIHSVLTSNKVPPPSGT